MHPGSKEEYAAPLAQAVEVKVGNVPEGQVLQHLVIVVHATRILQHESIAGKCRVRRRQKIVVTGPHFVVGRPTQDGRVTSCHHPAGKRQRLA